MAARKYFYTENGVTKQYVYCTRCGSGPYKGDSMEIHRCGDHTIHCPKCLKELRIKSEIPSFTIQHLERAVEVPESPSDVQEDSSESV